MTVDEYLRTSFDDSDCDFLDGQVVERNWGDFPHAQTQGNVCLLLHRFRASLGLRVVLEIRLRIAEQRYRVADVAAWLSDDIGTTIPTVAPFLVVEVLSPEDRLARTILKLQDYLAAGIEYIWVVDPIDHSAMRFSQSNPTGEVVDVLRTENPLIEISLADVFSLDL